MAQTAIEHPEGIIKDVLYPVVSEQTLKDLVKEFKHTGPACREKIHTVIRASYGSHYRRMVPEILGILDFRSNNDVHRPVIRALELIEKYAETGMHYFPFTDDIPIDGVIRTTYKEIIIEKDEKGQERINRINYEISAEELRRFSRPKRGSICVLLFAGLSAHAETKGYSFTKALPSRTRYD